MDGAAKKGAVPAKGDSYRAHDRSLKNGSYHGQACSKKQESIAENDLEGKKRRREKRARHKEYRRQLREQQEAEAARLEEVAE